MKASIAFLLAACTSTIMGEDIISMITECARDCLLESVKIATNCKSKDYECACDNAEKIQDDGQNCVIQACGRWKILRKSCLPLPFRFERPIEIGSRFVTCAEERF